MKKQRLLALVIALVMCASFAVFGFAPKTKAYAASQYEIHYWNFDDTLSDVQGGYDLIGEPVYAEGKNGKALNLAEMSVAPKTEKLTCNTLNGFTMGAWVYINEGASHYNIIMSKGNTSAADPDRFQFHFYADAETGETRYLAYAPATRGVAYPDAAREGDDCAIKVPQATWLHVVTTWDGNLAKMFLDGEKVCEVAIEGELDNSIAGFNNIRIGALNNGTEFKLDGLIDDAFYANYAMTEDDVKAAAGADGAAKLAAWADGTTPFTPAEMKEREMPVTSAEEIEQQSGLVLYWPFDNNYNDMSHMEFDFDFDEMCPDFEEGKAGQGVLLEDASICTDFFDPSVNLQEFTLAFWFRWDAIQAGTLPYYILAALGDKAQDYHFELYLKSEDCEKGSLCIYNPGGLVANDLYVIEPGKYYQVSMVNSEKNGFKVYLNGELVYARAAACNISALTAGDEKFTIGALQDYSLLSYGLYDEVILADHVLSEDLLMKLYSDPAAAAKDVMALVEANYPEDYSRPTPRPTAEPTEVPTQAPATEVPTQAPATDAPVVKPTSKPGDNKPAKSDNGALIGIIAGAAVLVIAIVAAIIVVLKKKKK